RPRPEKKSAPAAPAATKVLPMELQVGDRLADEASDWEVIAPPYSTMGGRMVHARVQRIDEPATWQIRSWDASKPVSVKRTTAEEANRGWHSGEALHCRRPPRNGGHYRDCRGTPPPPPEPVGRIPKIVTL